MRKRLWLAAGMAVSLVSPVGAQVPGIDAPTGAGVEGSAQRGPGRRAGEQPATPSEIAPRGNAANPDPASIGNNNGRTRGNIGITGSTESKIDGSAPVDSGIGRSGAGPGSGAMKGSEAPGSAEVAAPR